MFVMLLVIINSLILSVWRSTLDVRIFRLQTSASDGPRTGMVNRLMPELDMHDTLFCQHPVLADGHLHQ